MDLGFKSDPNLHRAHGGPFRVRIEARQAVGAAARLRENLESGSRGDKIERTNTFVIVIGREDGQNSNIGKQRCAYNRRNIELPAAAWNLIPLSRFPPGESRGGERFPPRRDTFRASQQRWHGPCGGSPRKRGLRPPCAIPRPVSADVWKRERLRPGKKIRMAATSALTFTTFS